MTHRLISQNVSNVVVSQNVLWNSWDGISRVDDHKIIRFLSTLSCVVYRLNKPQKSTAQEADKKTEALKKIPSSENTFTLKITFLNIKENFLNPFLF